MKKFLGSIAIAVLVLHAVLRINDPVQIFDTFVNFVIETSRNVTVVEKIWKFIVSPVVYFNDHILHGFFGDIFSGKGMWGAFLELIFGGR